MLLLPFERPQREAGNSTRLGHSTPQTESTFTRLRVFVFGESFPRVSSSFLNIELVLFSLIDRLNVHEICKQSG